MDQLGATLAQVVQNNQQVTEGLAQKQEQLRVQAARQEVCKHSHRWSWRSLTEAEVLSTSNRLGNQTSCAGHENKC